MDPDKLLRRISNNVPHQPETDWAGRAIPSRSEIEHAINKSQAPQPSRKQLRQTAREERRGRGIERG